MGVKYILEGPKGAGKSTLSKKLLKKLGKNNTNILHFDSENLLDMYKMQKHKLQNDKNYIYDRGYLSYMIYGWVQDYQLSFSCNVDYTNVSITGWAPLSRKHFVELINNIDDDGKFYILYASDWSILKERIIERYCLTGKGATEEEMEALELSNILYMHYAYILKQLEKIENKKTGKTTCKVVPIDICKSNQNDLI